MHFVVSSTWGPTDPTRAAIPFIFAAKAAAEGDTVLLMLFHDAVSVGVAGTHEKLIPFGPGPKFAEAFASENVEVVVCKPCAEVRGIGEGDLVAGARFGGMGDLHAHASRDGAKVVAF